MIDKVKEIVNNNPAEKLVDKVLEGHPLKTETNRMIGKTGTVDDEKNKENEQAQTSKDLSTDQGRKLSRDEAKQRLENQETSLKEKVKEKLQDVLEPEAVLKHDRYQYVENEKDADGVAWVFVNHHKMVKYPFKFPELKPDECRFQVLYSGLCHSDSSYAEEHWLPHKYPGCPGHEVIGRITEVGADVKEFKIGDRVAMGGLVQNCGECEFCKKGLDNVCQGAIEQKLPYGDKYWGGYATHVQQRAQWLFKVPESLPDDKSAPILCAGVTCYAPLARYVKPGYKVAVLGMGGLGHMGIKIAKAMGCEVTGFTSNEDKIDLVKDLGADKVAKTSHEDLKQEAMKYDIVLNTITIAYSNFNELLALTKPCGTFIQVGMPAVMDQFTVNGLLLTFHQITLHGSLYGTRKEVKECLEFCAKHNIIPECEFYDFDHFPEAYHKVLKGNPVFRCVVNVKDYFRK